MPKRNLTRDSRKTFLTSFSLNIPIMFSVSATENKKKKLNDTFNGGRMVGLSRYLKQRFMEELGIERDEDLITKSEEFNKWFKQGKNIILNETPLAINEFPKWCDEVIDIFLKERESGNGKNKK